MNALLETHLATSLNKVESLYRKAIDRIEKIKPGAENKLTQSSLIEYLALETGQTEAQIYPVLRVLLDGYPLIKQSRGRYGGLERVLLVEKTDDGLLTNEAASPKIEGVGEQSSPLQTKQTTNNKEHETNG